MTLFLLITGSNSIWAADSDCDQVLASSYKNALRELAKAYIHREEMRVEGASSTPAFGSFTTALDEKKEELKRILTPANFALAYQQALALEFKIRAAERAARATARTQTQLTEAHLLPPTLRFTLSEHKGWVYGAAFSPDGQLVATSAADKTIIIWNAKTGQLVRRLRGHTANVNSVSFSPNGQYLVTAADDKAVILWTVADGQEARRYLGHESQVKSAYFSPNGHQILTCSNDGTVGIWQTQSAKRRATLGQLKNAFCYEARWSPNGQFVVAGFEDGRLVVWNAGNKEIVREDTAQKSPIYSVDFSASGAEIITSAGDLEIWIRSVWPDAKTQQLKGHTGVASIVRFSPNGKYIMTGGDDRIAILWDATTGEKLNEIPGPDQAIQDLAFGPDSRSVIVTGKNSAAVWDFALVSDSAN